MSDNRTVAIVGTRKATPYDGRVTEHISRDLALAGVTIVSGLALGIDGIAHSAAIEQTGGRTTGALACGVERGNIYPASHHGLAGF